MNRLLGLVAILPACVTAVDTSERDQSIVGGQSANIADYPTVVALENSPGNWYCTGTLIAPEWILTAAHCVEGERAADNMIRFDDQDINDTSGGLVVAVAEIHANPGYDGIAWDNDVALIKLATPVTDRAPTPVHRPVVATATTVIEVGDGDADDNGGGAGVLRKLNTPTIDCATTQEPGVSGDNILCFDASDGNASCYGDSGGPAFVDLGGGSYAVAGITSGGTQDSCIQGWDLYTSVAGELAYIDQVVSGLDPAPDPDPTPDPDPDPNPKDDDDGGCSTGGSGGGLLLVGFALLLQRRRR
ncbi:MAG: serine protease [Kofleriaceae bacterium]